MARAEFESAGRSEPQAPAEELELPLERMYFPVVVMVVGGCEEMADVTKGVRASTESSPASSAKQAMLLSDEELGMT